MRQLLYQNHKRLKQGGIMSASVKCDICNNNFSSSEIKKGFSDKTHYCEQCFDSTHCHCCFCKLKIENYKITVYCNEVYRHEKTYPLCSYCYCLINPKLEMRTQCDICFISSSIYGTRECFDDSGKKTIVCDSCYLSYREDIRKKRK